MNDLGWALVWLAIQVAVVMVPALVLQALASHRVPASGAWVATWSLGLALFLGLSLVTPLGLLAPRSEQVNISASPPTRPADGRPIGTMPGSETIADGRRDDEMIGRTLTLETLRSALTRLERKAVEPAARLRTWGRMLAIVAVGGSLVGLIRLMVGLWAVGHCRRAGRVVEDPAMIALVEELRKSMGCLGPVEIREVADLTTPATAGWRRPMVLLPDNWRSWDDSERRAVIAHEFAHIIRGDYAAGLVARFAVVLHAYHPLVRWMAGRLTLQQELAADAIGAEFAGGRESYLLALSRLVLKQEGRTPTWPARAFLPPRGTLIRRIKMLRNENGSNSGRGWSDSLKLMTIGVLVTLTIGVASWRAPVVEAEEPATPAAKAKVETVAEVKPFDVSFVPDGMTGVFAIHPARLVNHPGIETIEKEIRDRLLVDHSLKNGDLVVDRSLDEAINFGCKDIESVVVGLKFGRLPDQTKNEPSQPTGTLEFHGLMVRAVAPFDWMPLLRRLKVGYDEEMRTDGGTYYKATLKIIAPIMPGECVYLPDDRTLVFGDEKWIKQVISRKAPSVPDYLRGADWERASRGIMAFALNNKNEPFDKFFDSVEVNEVMVLGLLKGIERMVVGFADADPIAMRLEFTGQDAQTLNALALTLKTLTASSLKNFDLESFGEGVQRDGARFYQKFLTSLKFQPNGTSLSIVAEGFGKLTDFASLIKADIEMDQKAAQIQKAAEMEARKAEEKSKNR